MIYVVIGGQYRIVSSYKSIKINRMNQKGRGSCLVNCLSYCLLMAVIMYSICSYWCSLNWTLPKSMEAKVVTVEGYVASLPRLSGRAWSFYLHLDRIGKVHVSGKIKLAWYQVRRAIHVGDRWQLLVKLKRPRGFADPGAFDYAQYLRLQGVGATGYVKAGAINHLLCSHWQDYPVGRLRAYLARVIGRSLGGDSLSGVITALVVGSRNGISQRQWQVFRDTGTSHLVAISGLHIGLVFAFIFLFINAIIKRLTWIVRRFPSKSCALVLGFMGALCYSILAGFGLPTQRAVIMIFVFVVALLWRRNVSVWRGIALAFCFVLLLHPLALQSPSFMLSFFAVGVLLYSFSGRIFHGQHSFAERVWWRWGRAQVIVIVGLMPLSFYLFKQISLLSWLANLVAIPVVGLLVVPLSLAAILLLSISKALSQIMLWTAVKVLHLVWNYLLWLSQQHWAVYHHTVTSWWMLLLGVLGVSIILLPSGMPSRWLGLVILWPIIFSKSAPPPYGDVDFTLLDVGQGLASVVRTEHHLLVYDTGPKFSETFDAGEAVVVPYLRYMNLTQINMLVVSHGDNDHIGGAACILSAMHVRKIMTSVPKRFTPRKAEHCWAGQSWQWDGVQFKFLSPPRGSDFTGNNGSCVLKVSAGKKSILLTGDMQALAEEPMVKHYKNILASTIVVAPHHGSNTSSTIAFVRATHPKYILFPVGYLNRFHFPNPEVMHRYQSVGAKLLSTATAGAITFSMRKDAVQATLYR